MLPPELPAAPPTLGGGHIAADAADAGAAAAPPPERSPAAAARAFCNEPLRANAANCGRSTDDKFWIRPSAPPKSANEQFDEAERRRPRNELTDADEGKFCKEGGCILSPAFSAVAVAEFEGPSEAAAVAASVSRPVGESKAARSCIIDAECFILPLGGGWAC